VLRLERGVAGDGGKDIVTISASCILMYGIITIIYFHF